MPIRCQLARFLRSRELTVGMDRGTKHAMRAMRPLSQEQPGVSWSFICFGSIVLFLASVYLTHGGADGQERVVLFVMAVVSIHIWSSEVAAHGMRVKVWGGKWSLENENLKQRGTALLSTRPIHRPILVYTYSALVTVTPRCSHSSAA